MTIQDLLGQTVFVKSLCAVPLPGGIFTSGPTTILGVDPIKERLFIRTAGLIKDPNFGWNLNYLIQHSPEDAARIAWAPNLQPAGDEKLQYIKMSDCEINPQ